jgi:hypothetical protein
MAMKYQENKEGVFVGEGFWKWRLEILNSGKDVKYFDDYFFNYFQLLSNNRSFDRLRAFPIKNEFTQDQKVSFKGITYNELYEEIYGEDILLKIKGEKGNEQEYTFVSSQSKTGFVLPFQSPGIYSYTCEAFLSNKKFFTRGKYVVNRLKLEHLNFRAQFDKLRSLVIRQGGEFRKIEDDVDESQAAVRVIQSSSEEKELIEYRWLFFILCFLLSVEWFLRKYLGVL